MIKVIEGTRNKGRNMKFALDNIVKILDLGFGETKEVYTHPSRKLEWNVFLYVSKGEMEVWEEETEYIVKEGQFLFLENGLAHRGEPKTPAGTSWYWVHYFPSNVPESYQEANPHITSHKSIEVAQEEYQKYISLPKQGVLPNAKVFEKRISRMIELFLSSDPYRAVSLSLQTIELFISIYRGLSEKSNIKKSDQTVDKVVKYLESKDKYYLDSKELEEHLSMNYSYLCDVFKKKMGTTIHNYSSRIFISRAIGMMQTTNMNISEISEQLGFKNPFYFSRVFKKVVGCAPSNYLSRIY